MPRTIRFHLDENCSRAIADGLRRRGVDVTTTPESGLLGAIDEDQASHALAEGRVIFTQDQDFLRINAAGSAHAGIAYCPKDSRSVGEIIDGLALRRSSSPTKSGGTSNTSEGRRASSFDSQAIGRIAGDLDRKPDLIKQSGPHMVG